ncbi:MAG: glycosyltransferase family 9 protein [Pseudonocardiaceae bacterium]|nr:glycosyltransferase family 9 protein [Pseudonocardiaceae bacterium]
MPAIQALADAYPQAELVMIGSPGHAALLGCRPSPVDTVLALPRSAVSAEPGEPAKRRLLERARPVDVAVQLHDGGTWSNGFVQRLQARLSVGARAPDAGALDRTVPYDTRQHDVFRVLEIAGLAGAEPTVLRPRVAVTDQDLAEGSAALAGLPEPVLTVHPGGTDPRRRWPVERFAEVAVAAADGGTGIAIVGSADERQLVRELATACRDRLPRTAHDTVRPLAGVLSGAGLTGVLARSEVLLANDSGPRHLADAVGTPTVSVYWAANLINAGPLGRDRHRVHVSTAARCPLCDVEYAGFDGTGCEHDGSVVASVSAREVLPDVIDLLPTKEKNR